MKHLAILIFLVTAISCNNKQAAENKNNKNSDFNERNAYASLFDDFVNGTLMYFDSVPRPNIQRIFSYELENKVNHEIVNQFNPKNVGSTIFRTIDENYIVTSATIDSVDNVVFVIGFYIDGNLYCKTLHNAVSNEIVSFEDNNEFYSFYGFFRLANCSSHFYNMTLYKQDYRLSVHLADYFPVWE